MTTRREFAHDCTDCTHPHPDYERDWGLCSRAGCGDPVTVWDERERGGGYGWGPRGLCEPHFEELVEKVRGGGGSLSLSRTLGRRTFLYDLPFPPSEPAFYK